MADAQRPNAEPVTLDFRKLRKLWRDISNHLEMRCAESSAPVLVLQVIPKDEVGQYLLSNAERVSAFAKRSAD
jgi:hypothetical protein